jgi:GT2 family glycosyltransferase
MTHATNKFTDHLLVVLVLFQTTLRESAAFISLTNALNGASGSIFIYDNSPEMQVLPETDWTLHYQHDPTNPGVSKAYNEGFKIARQLNKRWMLLVDQDTFFPDTIFEKYFEARVCSEIVVPILKDDAGVVSPLEFYLGGGQRLSVLKSNQTVSLKKYFFHNSGLLISTDAFEKANGYDENLPLDFSDFSFVHRLRRTNDQFFVADVLCKHSLASTSAQPAGQRLGRFCHYAKSARHYKKNYHASSLLLPRVFLRAIKLSWQYRTTDFLFAYFRE